MNDSCAAKALRRRRLRPHACFAAFVAACALWDPASAEPPANTFRIQDAVYTAESTHGSAVSTSFRRQTLSSSPLPTEDLLHAALADDAECPAAIRHTAQRIAPAFGIDPAIVLAIIATESSCNRKAVSKEGAQGLMQLMPGSGARAAFRIVHGRDGVPTLTDLQDPGSNILLGVSYFSALMDRFAFVASPEVRVRLAIASYNCGPNFISRRLPLVASGWSAGDAELWIKGNLPPQTRKYVVEVLRRSESHRPMETAVDTTSAVAASAD